jgi:DNA repair protein RecN (Recombination protein N)
MLVSAETEIASFADGDSRISALYERLSAAEIELADIADELESAAEQVELDGQRLGYLSNRLNTINKLKRKYALDCEGLVKLYDDACREIMQLEGSGDEIKSLSEKREQLLHKVTEEAKALYDYREEVAERFTRRVTEELEFLNMAGVGIAVRHEKGKLTVNGMDTVEFLISANRGEEPKPISRIASGGELSRIMLALKSVIADKDSIPTMIFDEIDTGISGKTAQLVADRMSDIACNHQVIAVTHLPQIASHATTHFLIEKTADGMHTATSVRSLTYDESVEELARMLAGSKITDAVRDNAAELKRNAGRPET